MLTEYNQERNYDVFHAYFPFEDYVEQLNMAFIILSEISVLLNIMFYGPMGIFQLELIYFITYFSTIVPYNSCVFLSCRPFVVNATFSTGLVGR